MPHVQLNPGSTPSKKIVTGATPETVLADFYQVAATAVGQEWELELQSELLDQNKNPVATMSDIRRAVGKSVRISRGALEISFADVDLDKLTATYPFKSFTTADFSRLYVDHVGNPIPDLGPGTHLKVPMSMIDDNGGAGPWKFSPCESRSGPTYTINTIYRDGQIVSATEYSTGTTTGASTGVVVRHASFAREQRDTGNRLYTLEADITVTGSREPSAELSRILQLYGVAIDAASFTAAAAVDNAFGIFCDAGYTRARSGRGIVEDLLRMARGDLAKTPTNAWGIVQDKIRTSTGTYDEGSSLIELDGYEQPEIPVETVAYCRPAQAGNDSEWLVPPLRRATGGNGKVLTLPLPFCYDANVADRLCDFYSKRSKLWRASFKVYSAQWDNGDMLDITSTSCWSGVKSFVSRGITRIADGNQIDAREYDANVFTYTAGTIPSGAGNTYAPDYSQTPPAAPSGLSVVSQGTNQATAYALIRVTTPPSVNWASIVAQIKNSSTNEIYQATLQLNGGNYEATISGLKTGSSHTVVAWAVNPRGVQGVATSAVGFTSPGPAQYISDTHITTGGVTNTSVGNSTLTLTRQNTADYYFSSSVASGANIDLTFLAGTYMPRITADFPADFTMRPASDVGGLGSAHVGVYNNAGVARTLYRYYKVLQ